MSSCSSYTTVFPDCSNLNFKDSDSASEDSDSDSVSSFFKEDLSEQVRILRQTVISVNNDHKHNRTEMMQLHGEMVGLITDLLKLVSPIILPLPSPDSSPLKLAVMDVCPLTNYTPSEPSLNLPSRQDKLHLPKKQDDSHLRQSDDTPRKQQQQQQQDIDQLVAYIDERAAHYYRSRPTSI